MPRGAEDSRYQQHEAEVDDCWSPECIDLAEAGASARLGNEGDHDKLQACQRTGGRAHDYIKALPAMKRFHDFIHLYWNLRIAAGLDLLPLLRAAKRANPSFHDFVAGR